MPDCPLADDCPSFSERIEGMGCQHYGDRGGKEWCNHYDQPIEDLKTQPVQPGEEVVVDVDDMHESGAGVGHTEDGFVVMVDGVLPPARARVKVTRVNSNFAWGDELERLPMEDEEDDADDGEAADADAEAEGEDADADADAEAEGEDADAEEEEDEDDEYGREERLGSRENFWGG
jgi:predicted RNA-binding protein with TRAM domain